MHSRRRTMRYANRWGRWHLPMPARKNATLPFCGGILARVARGGSAAKGGCLCYSRLASRTSFLRRARSGTLRSPPSRRSRPIEASRLNSRETASRCVLMRLAISERDGAGDNNACPFSWRSICSKAEQLGMNSILNHKRAELEHPLGQSPYLPYYMPNCSNSDHWVGQQQGLKLGGCKRGDCRPLYSLYARRTRSAINRGDFAEHRSRL